MKSAMRRSVVSSLVCAVMATGLTMIAPLAHASKDKPEIGFCIDDLRVERWSRDRDYFVAAATKLGAKVSVQSADASEARQISQIENLISRGVDVIVIVPFNSKTLGNVVAEARKAGIKVVSYDRLILDADVDAYISFDNEKVGELQAQGVFPCLWHLQLSTEFIGEAFLVVGIIDQVLARILNVHVAVGWDAVGLALVLHEVAVVGNGIEMKARLLDVFIQRLKIPGRCERRDHVRVDMDEIELR